MKKGIVIGAAALLAVGSVGAAAWAVGPNGPGRYRMMKHMISARIEDAEDLIQATPAQRTQIEASKEVILNAVQAKMQNRAQNHGQLIALLTADKLDTQALYNLANQHAQDVQDLAKVIVPEIQKIHDVLTPSQRATLAQHAKDMHQKRMNHHGAPGGFGGPPEE
ncbi:MAG TPA: Spy/CpxP family protein refolding chaperone [Myxococcales bacterium]|nr:Spy/CpxP family protein refolding chaperone [Myxococcales bacterium]